MSNKPKIALKSKTCENLEQEIPINWANYIKENTPYLNYYLNLAPDVELEQWKEAENFQNNEIGFEQE